MLEKNILYQFVVDHKIEIEQEQYISCFDLYADTIKKEYQRANLCGFGLVVKRSVNQTFNYCDIKLKQNDLVVINPYSFAKINDCSEDLHIIYLMIDSKYMLDFFIKNISYRYIWLNLQNAIFPYITLKGENAMLMYILFEKIAGTLKGKHLHKNEFLELQVKQIIIELSNILDGHKIPQKDKMDRKLYLYLSFILLMMNYFKTNREVSFYAEKLNISATYLSRIVKKLTGNTVMDFIDQMLLVEALYLLSETRESIQEVAEKLNFSDQAAFNKFIRRQINQSPSEFRVKRNIKSFKNKFVPLPANKM